MGKKEDTKLELDLHSLSLHTFVTGSTGSGKSNTIYQILSEAMKDGIKFLVIEPAKGEYKSISEVVKELMYMEQILDIQNC